jgi:hypothetical protein
MGARCQESICNHYCERQYKYPGSELVFCRDYRTLWRLVETLRDGESCPTFVNLTLLFASKRALS